MRRSKKINNTIFILLFLAAIFNILSFAMDQIVVQTEDKIRESNYNLSKIRINLNAILNSRNTLEEIQEDVHLEGLNLVSLYEFSQKKYAIFDSDDNYFRERDVSFLAESKDKNLIFYKDQMQDIIFIYNQKVDQFYLILNKSFDNDYFKNLFKENIFFNDILKKEYFKKINTNILENYNEKDDDGRYQVYNEIRKDIEKLISVDDHISSLQDIVELQYKQNYVEYIDYLNVFSERKNINNFIIIISILFQIIGVTFLLLLFKVLIKENY